MSAAARRRDEHLAPMKQVRAGSRAEADMRLRPLLILKWALGLALGAYVAAVALLYILQRDMLYRPPQTVRTLPGFVAERYAAARIVVWGFSLGTGPAVALAARQPTGKLVLEAPYTSTADVAATVLPFVPVRALMKDQFRSDQLIGKVKVPVLVMHGERDPGILDPPWRAHVRAGGRAQADGALSPGRT